MLPMPSPRSRNGARLRSSESCKHSSKLSVITFNLLWTQRMSAKTTAKTFAARFLAPKIFWQTRSSNFNCLRNTQQRGLGPLFKSGYRKRFLPSSNESLPAASRPNFPDGEAPSHKHSPNSNPGFKGNSKVSSLTFPPQKPAISWNLSETSSASATRICRPFASSFRREF
jgi:hypothetical protein